MRANNKFISIFLVNILLFISCQKNPNTHKITSINNLEKIALTDENNLKSINIEALQNNIKISKFNLMQLEEKELDSISIELIYFEYRDYLNCVNSMRLMLEKISNLKTEIAFNRNQLQHIKQDYLNSNNIRNDLDTHLIQERYYIKKVSTQIKQVVDLSEDLNEQFDTLNKEIELIINEE